MVLLQKSGIVSVIHQEITHVVWATKQPFVCWNGITGKCLVKVQSQIIYQLDTCSCFKLGSRDWKALFDELTTLIRINKNLVEKHHFLKLLSSCLKVLNVKTRLQFSFLSIDLVWNWFLINVIWWYQAMNLNGSHFVKCFNL